MDFGKTAPSYPQFNPKLRETMKNILSNISTWAVIIGALLTGNGLWDIYKERNVSLDPQPLPISAPLAESLTSEESMQFVKISGGQLDLANTFEISLTTKKGDTKLSTEYYIPVLAPDTNNVVYILQTKTEPSLNQLMEETHNQGLLKLSSELSDDLRQEYSGIFPGQSYLLLDSTYQAATLIDKLIKLKIFFIMLLVGIGIKVLLIKTRKKPEPETEAVEPSAN